MATRTYQSEPMAAVHEMMEGLHKGGAIDEQTLRDFDAACLSSRPSRSPVSNHAEAIRLRNARH